MPTRKQASSRWRTLARALIRILRPWVHIFAVLVAAMGPPAPPPPPPAPPRIEARADEGAGGDEED